MKIGLFTDGLAHLPFAEALAKAASLGVQAVEIGTGNFSPSPHCDLNGLLAGAGARAEFLQTIERQQLQLAALNCSGNPVHPNQDLARQAAEATRKTLRLAGLLGVERVVCMSGCPGTPDGGRYPNWVVASWPEDFLELLEWQWRERVIPFWSEMAELARAEGVLQLCFELHPGMCVYNASSFNRLRAAVGPVIAANLDPSHFFFQGMDPLAVIRTLGASIGYVHAKDARVEPYNLAVQGSLDLQPGKPVRDLVWAYRTLGYGHGARFWADFVSALRSVGYDGVLSIEHEDPLMDAEEAIGRAVDLLRNTAFFGPPSIVPGAPPPY
ncbi:MAG TPA: sugar phosphate isomerase/epimerase [Bryobacteraceae bacterium]|jgi:sugar phosphate isomerase/epimerase|nr:sugar phosphate isomerase/epimerase [Bryobacteraceae bacterium]HXJ39569.1 sugar phosphate isomerase/epimerase [Bryobacteraceae bacterium]